MSDDVFGRKRLTVLNRAAPAAPSQYVLEDAGMEPNAIRSAEPVALEPRIVEALRKIHDPEIPLNIYDLGLVYRVAVDDDRRVELDMSLTSP
ncbi:MAG TPA: iron-sulfur cluster assembly protein, partial [Polyangiaceae bacterium]